MSIKAHWHYLKYVLEHKYWVYVEGRKLGLGRWQLLTHDMSKFSRAEWNPYVQKFYGHLICNPQLKKLKRKVERDNQNPDRHRKYQDPKRKQHQEVAYNFKRAWLHHQNVNPHHWQYWVLLNDFGNPEKPLEMPDRYMLEMVADWRGVSRVKHKTHTDEQIAKEVREFYQNTASSRKLHDITKMKVEALLDVEVPGVELLQDPSYKDGEPPITSGWQKAPMNELSDALRDYQQDLLQEWRDQPEETKK